MKKFTPKKKAYRKRTYKKAPVSAKIKNYVNKAIAVRVENKVINFSSNLTVCSYVNDNTLRSSALTPNGAGFTLTQGTAQNARIGNSITIKKIMFNYTLYPLGYDVTTNTTPKPGVVQMILARVKQAPNDIPNSTHVGLLFQAGNSAGPPTGSITDANKMFNKDYWTILKSWTHKVGYASIDGTGGQIARQYHANNDFPMFVQRKMNITKYCNKIMKFQDNTSYTQTPGIFLMTQWLNADGTIAGGSQLMANLEYYINFEYEDS